MRKEIEVKARVQNLEVIAKELARRGCVLSDPIEQRDIIFVDSSYGEFEKFHPKKNLLRIRNAKGKFIFTIKQPQSNELDSIERETEIANPEEMEQALLLMGYHERVRVSKIRKTAKYQNWEICLDEVEGIGSFVEIEELTDDKANPDEIQRRILEFLKSLGVKEEDRVTTGYATLVYLNEKRP
ncbi:MAG: class IV adenylate cyclase [Patescibacteria group bacterium]